MSNVAIKGGATGTATYTIEAPTGNTDRTLVLPDEAGTVITSGSYVAGITQADHYRHTTHLTSDGTFTNWERPDDVAGVATLGSGVSVSSGVFTFPETGFYLVIARSIIDITGSDRVTLELQYTSNNSSYVLIALSSVSTDRDGGSLTRLLDITDTTNQKVRLVGSSIDSGSRFQGSSTNDRTTITFIRLGDT